MMLRKIPWLVTLGVTFAGVSQAAPSDSVARSASNVHPDTTQGRVRFALVPGTPVRLVPSMERAGGPAFHATLLRITEDSLWVTRSRDDRELQLARTDVHLQVRTGRSHLKGALSGGAIGLFVGLGAGALLAAVYASQNNDPVAEHLQPLVFITFPIAGAAVGIPLGAAIGGSMGADRWERVP